MSQLDPRLLQYQDFAQQQLAPQAPTPGVVADAPLSSSLDPRLLSGQTVARKQLETAGLLAQNSRPHQPEINLDQQPEINMDDVPNPARQGTFQQAEINLDQQPEINIDNVPIPPQKNVTDGQGVADAQKANAEMAAEAGTEVPKDYPLSWKGAAQAPSGPLPPIVSQEALVASAQTDPRLLASQENVDFEQQRLDALRQGNVEMRMAGNDAKVAQTEKVLAAREARQAKMVIAQEEAAKLQHDYTTKRQKLEEEIARGPKIDHALSAFALAAVALGGMADIASARGGGEAKYGKGIHDMVIQAMDKSRKQFFEAKESERAGMDNVYAAGVRAGLSDKEAMMAGQDAMVSKLENQLQLKLASATSAEDSNVAQQQLSQLRLGHEKEIHSGIQRELDARVKARYADAMALRARAAGGGGAGGAGGKKEGVLVNPAEIAMLEKGADEDGRYTYVPWENEAGQVEMAAFDTKTIGKEEAQLVQGLAGLSAARQEMEAEVKRLGGMDGITPQIWNRWIAKNDGVLNSLQSEAILSERELNAGAGALDAQTAALYKAKGLGGLRDNPAALLAVLKKYQERKKAAAASVLDHFSEKRKLMVGATTDGKGNVKEHGEERYHRTRLPNAGDRYYQKTDAVAKGTDARLPEKPKEPETPSAIPWWGGFNPTK